MAEIQLGESFRLTADYLENEGDTITVTITTEPVLRPKAETKFNSDTWDLVVELPDGKTLTWGLGVTILKKLMGVFGKDGANWVGKQIRLMKIPSSMAKSGYTLSASPVVQEFKLKQKGGKETLGQV